MINGGEVSNFNKLEYLITYFVVVFYADNGLKEISNKTSKTINRLKKVNLSTGQMISYVVVNLHIVKLNCPIIGTMSTYLS